MNDNSFGWDDVGQFADQILSGIGTNFEANAQNNAAVAQKNMAYAALIKTRAQNEAAATETRNKATLILVTGLVAFLLLYVFAKFILPKL